MTNFNPHDKAVEFGIVLSNGMVFYTGGFDEVPDKTNMRWEAGVNGTFVNASDSPWYVTYLDPDKIVGVIDYRSKD